MHGDGRIFLRGRIYWAQIYRDGRRLQVSLKTDLKSVALAKLKKLNRMHDDEFLAQQERSVTVGQLFANLLDHYALEGKDAYRRGCEKRWEQHLKERFENLRAHKFGSSQQHAYRKERVAEGASNTTVNRELAILSAAFRVGAAQDPPLVKRVPHFHRTTENNARRGYANSEQLEALERAASKHALWLRVMVEMAVLLGWRRGELEGLTTRNIDLIDGIIRIEHSKNSEPREVPIPATMRPLLEALLAGKQPGERLFGNLHTRVWKAVVAEAGVPELKFHDLRRTSARNKRAAGVDTSVTMQLMGWKTEAMFRRYGIVAVEDKAEALRRQEAYQAAQRQPKLPN